MCVGRPIADLEVNIIRIIDGPIESWSDDLLLDTGNIGEIAVKGDLVSRQYFNRPRADALSKIRDHQGDVWPWLLGPFIDAYSRAYPERPLGRYVQTLLCKHLDEACVGSISEVFGGDAPHEPEGCISQAWSVAEVLRVLHEHPLLFADGLI